MKQSGATNRQRHKEAESERHREERFQARRLANLSPEQAERARRIMGQVLRGELQDPDRGKPDDED